MDTVADFIYARRKDKRPGLYYQDQQWTYEEYTHKCCQRAAWLLANRKPGPFHVGIALGNVPEFAFWAGACAIAGATMVGLNPTRRGDDMGRDITHTDCAVVISDSQFLGDGTIPPEPGSGAQLVNIESDSYAQALAFFEHAPWPEVNVKPTDIYCLILTSGTTGAPKAVVCSHGRFAQLSLLVGNAMEITPASVSYVVMPWFHANAIYMGWLPALSQGAGVVIGKFSVSGFLPDIRKFGVTHFNYVGKPLAYLLSNQERENDADTTLRKVVGNEGNVDDIERFAKRFGCEVYDGYGSTEGGIFINRISGMPRNALGVSADENVKIMDRDTLSVCPRAKFGSHGELLNANEAIGEIVNTAYAGTFEGYYKNPEAEQKRIYKGIVWSGDLGYQDSEGYFYFAGRNDDWLRVDGENIAAAQIEQVLVRHAPVMMASVYAIPDPVVGDSAMAAIQVAKVSDFNISAFEAFMDGESDFSSKWKPRFIRISTELPRTATEKVLKRQLRVERLDTDEAIWWQAEKHASYSLMTGPDKARYSDQLLTRGDRQL